MPRAKALACLALFIPTPLAVLADERDRMEMAIVAGHERLRLRAFGDHLSSAGLEAGELAVMQRDMISQGYYFDGGAPALVARDSWVAPMLAWDGNINGGVLQSRFAMNGLIFEADPEVQAKSGLVAGMVGGFSSRHAWQNGRVVQVDGLIETGWSPEHEIGKADAVLSACLQNHLSGWNFLDLCAVGSSYWRELDQGSAYQGSVAYSRVVAFEDGLHEISLRYVRASTTGPDQDRIGLMVDSIWNKAATRIGLTFGEGMSEETVLRQRAEFGISWIAMAREWRLDAWTQTYEGGAFLGVPREDRISSLSLSAELRPGMSLSLGYLDSRSTAGIANYDQVTMDIRFDRLSW